MAVLQQTYFDAIGRAGLVFADGVTDLCNLERAGCAPDWTSALEQCKKIECAEFFYRNGDYAVSEDSAYFYNEMLCIAGTQYSDAEIDPNAQLPNTTIIIEDGSSTFDEAYDQDDLIDGDPPNGNWYLPLVDSNDVPYPSNYKPILVTVNGKSFNAGYESTFNPGRLYGFPDNSTQTIIVTYSIATTAPAPPPVTPGVFPMIFPLTLA